MTMKKYFFLPILLCGFLFSCNVEYGESPAPLISAGKSINCSVTDFTPDIVIDDAYSDGFEYVKDFDLNGDGQDDIRLVGYVMASNFGYSYGTYAKTLHINVNIAHVEDHEVRVYEYDDLISCDDGYGNGKLYFTDIEYSRDPMSDTEEVVSEDGVWWDLDNKYLAFQLYIDNEPHLGWIKIGLADTNDELKVYEFGLSSEPGCKN